MLCFKTCYLLVVHVAGTADECGPAFRMELEGGDAVPSVPLSWDLRGQHFQTVSGREAYKNKEPLLHSTLFD